MKANWLQAFVLHRRAYRETSYLVDFFTLEAGVVRAVAKGVKNSKGDRKSLLQPFGPVSVVLSGKSELKNLAQIESAGRSVLLQGKALFCAMYVNELVSRVMPAGLASESLFNYYQQTLEALVSTATPDVPLREFEFALLDEMGQLPDWFSDATTGAAIEPEQWYKFAQELGIVLARQPGEKHSFPGHAVLAMAQGEWSNAARQAGKLISRQALLPLLGGKPLKSRELFR